MNRPITGPTVGLPGGSHKYRTLTVSVSVAQNIELLTHALFGIRPIAYCHSYIGEGPKIPESGLIPDTWLATQPNSHTGPNDPISIEIG